MRIIRWKVDWHFSHRVLHAFLQRRQLHPLCLKWDFFFFFNSSSSPLAACWRESVRHRFSNARGKRQAHANARTLARLSICVHAIQSRACAYFWFLSVWEWENIHIAHLGSSWEPIELSCWKNSLLFLWQSLTGRSDCSTSSLLLHAPLFSLDVFCAWHLSLSLFFFFSLSSPSFCLFRH